MILLGIKAFKICYFMGKFGVDFLCVFLMLIASPALVKSNLEKSGDIMHLLLPAPALGLKKISIKVAGS